MGEFGYADEGVGGGQLVGTAGEEEAEGFYAILVGNSSVQRLDVHSEDEVLGKRELEVLEEVEGMGGVHDVNGEFLDRGEKIESRQRFTCTSVNVVYCICCSRCGLLYI
eukprot:g19160.t1